MPRTSSISLRHAKMIAAPCSAGVADDGKQHGTDEYRRDVELARRAFDRVDETIGESGDEYSRNAQPEKRGSQPQHRARLVLSPCAGALGEPLRLEQALPGGRSRRRLAFEFFACVRSWKTRKRM